MFTQAPARKSERFFHYLILMVVTRRARGTESTADWQLYKHLTAIHGHSESCVCLALGCPATWLPERYLLSLVVIRSACQEGDFSVTVCVCLSMCVGHFHFHLYSREPPQIHWCVFL